MVHEEKGVSVKLVLALNFECGDLKRSFSVCQYIFGKSTSSSYIKVIGSRLKSQDLKIRSYERN